MSIPMIWDNEEKTILCVDRTKKFDWVEFDQSVDESYRMIAERPGSVDMLVRIDLTVPLPPDPMPHMRRLFESKPKNLRYIVIVGAERTTYNFQTVIFEMFMRMFSSLAKQMRFASSLDEARAMIARAGSNKREPVRSDS